MVRSTAFLKSFRQFLHLHSGDVIALLLIGLIGLLSVSWFRGDYLIAAGDFSMPLNRLRSSVANFYSWDSRSLGNSNPRILALTVPLGAYFAFSEVIGLSSIGTEKILFYFIFTVSGLSMYYLTTTLLSTFRHKRLAGLISGVFYMLNPYVAINIMPLRQTSFIIYALLPLILGIFIRGLNQKKPLKFAIIAAFIMLLATSLFVDPSIVPLTFLPLLIYLIFFVLTNPKRTTFFSAFKFASGFTITWILLNLYWLIPDAYSSSNELAKVTSAYGSIGVQSGVQLDSSPILGAVRLLGYWALDSGYKGDPYFVWASAYQTPLLIIVSFILPFLAFIPLLLKPKDKNVLFFTSFAVISLLLVNGSYSPLGKWIFSNIPLFAVFFRTPYLRFGMYVTLAYAFLIGYALTELFNRFSSHLKKTRYLIRQIISGVPIVLMLFLIVGVYAFPLWTGDVIRPGTEVMQSNRYQMPTYYQTASDWLGTDAADFKIIGLPISKLGFAEFKWENGGYTGPYPAEWLFPKPVIPSTLDSNGIAGLFNELIVKNSSIAASKLLALMNVKYVLFHEDTNWLYIAGNSWWISTSPEQFQSILGSSAALTLEKKFGELDFYRNNYWSPMHIYAATNTILIDGGLNQTLKIMERTDFKPEESVLLLSDQLDAQQISALPLSTIFIQYQNSSSTYYALSSVLNKGRIVYTIDSQPFITARYYSGWKSVITTNGQGDPGMLIFQSPTECPYISYFPLNFTSWNAYNSTLIYITTASSPLTISSIQADENQTNAIYAWWETATSWETGWPITIPAHQQAVIQVNQNANVISLQTGNGIIALQVIDGWTNPPPTQAASETSTTVFTPKAGNYLLAMKVATGYGYGKLLTKIDNQTFNIDANSQEQGPVFAYKYLGPISLTAGYHAISTSGENTTIPIYDGLANPINWTSTFTNQTYAARYYPEWKAVVRTDGSEPWDTLSFSTTAQSPYTFPLNFTSWNAYNSTLVYLVAGDNPLRIDEIMTDGNTTSDITGVWWQTDWMGMSTKTVTFPIIIPPLQKAIIQINHNADIATLKTNPQKMGSMLLYSLRNGETSTDANNLFSSNQTGTPSITYEKINPTKYTVHVNASNPFFLVFSESYDKDWIATIEGRQVSNEYHFTANGFANGWYINKTGEYTVTLEFWPQKLFFVGSAISITTFILCTLYLSKNKIKKARSFFTSHGLIL